jgi:hypothetical protein
MLLFLGPGVNAMIKDGAKMIKNGTLLITKKKEFLFQNIDITFVHILKKRLKCGEFRVCFSIPFEYAYTFNLTMFVCNIKNFAQDKMDAALSRLICSTVTNSSLKQFRPENELNPICLLKRSAGFKTALTETS